MPNDEQQSKEKEIRALTIQLEEMKRTLELKEKEKERDILYQQRVMEFFLNAHKVNHIHVSSSTQCSIETADNATQVQEGIILMSYFNHVLCINLFF